MQSMTPLLGLLLMNVLLNAIPDDSLIISGCLHKREPSDHLLESI